MATYTLNATVTGKRGSARNAVIPYTENTSNRYIGSTGATAQYSCILAFDSVQMAAIRALGADAIISATLYIHASTAASNPFHPYYGAKKASGTSSSEIVSSHQVAVAKNQTDITLDVTTIGIPTTDAFCIGSQANIAGESYATMRGISATLVVVTVDPGTDDIHIVQNGSIYGGSVFLKETTMKPCEVWVKVGGQMYKGE